MSGGDGAASEFSYGPVFVAQISRDLVSVFGTVLDGLEIWAKIRRFCGSQRNIDTRLIASWRRLNRLPVASQELILADAGYCSVSGIEYVCEHGADVLVRVNPQSFVAYSACGRRISLLQRLRTLTKAGQFGEWRVVLHGQGSAFAGRVCAVRKSDCAIQQAHRRLQRKASKKQMITRPGTLEFAKYVIVFTTRSSGSTADILRSYRMRWQIELVFKRLKSLAQLGHVPKHEGRSSRAWLYGKLLVTLLAQKLIRIGRDISPSGYPLSVWGTM